MSDSGTYLEFAQRVVNDALDAGATQCEVGITISDRFAAEARDITITKLEQSKGKSMQVRVFVNGKRATLSTSDFEPTELGDAIERLVDGAKYVAEDVHAGLPEPQPLDLGKDLDIYSAEIVGWNPQDKLDEALAMERTIRQADPRVQNSNGAHISDAATTTILANSHGIAGSYQTTRASRSVSPVAQDGDAKRTGSYGTAARHLHGLEAADAVARHAVKRTVEMFGARKPRTMRVPVIFERDVAAGVLGDIFTALSGSNVAVGNSWAADRIGDRIGSSLATIVDDGRLPGALGTSPFDSEGVPTRKTVVFEAGVLKSFMLDSYYARRLGLQSTANASGGGIGPNNFYLQNGDRPLEDLIAGTPRGVLILDTIGFATEYATGTYSRGARGFYIEDGVLAYPIEEFTIAGTFAEMLAGLDGVANDLRHDSGIVSPSFRVAEMTLSGN
ncbi:MAG: TldD/PmbA family protein [Candidatus Eremiobacteraeota bacterium]|nr:TldD/PmbA family protein [Candidatus Eremiobacteraeota bacterium]